MPGMILKYNLKKKKKKTPKTTSIGANLKLRMN